MSEDKKTVQMDLRNEEGRIKFTIKGKHAVQQSIAIAKAFDDACKEIQENNKVKKEDE